MPVNIDQWRAGIGRFHSRIVIPKSKKKWISPFFYNVFMTILILKAEDIETKTGTNNNSPSYFSCCHWNINRLAIEICRTKVL